MLPKPCHHGIPTHPPTHPPTNQAPNLSEFLTGPIRLHLGDSCTWAVPPLRCKFGGACLGTTTPCLRSPSLTTKSAIELGPYTKKYWNLCSLFEPCHTPVSVSFLLLQVAVSESYPALHAEAYCHTRPTQRGIKAAEIDLSLAG